MKSSRKIRFSYKQVFRVSLLLNAVLIILGTVLFLKSPASALSIDVIGSTGTSKSYKLGIVPNDIVFVYCNEGRSTASLGYLRNTQALTCASR
jgi:hypothetical protein